MAGVIIKSGGRVRPFRRVRYTFFVRYVRKTIPEAIAGQGCKGGFTGKQWFINVGVEIAPDENG